MRFRRKLLFVLWLTATHVMSAQAPSPKIPDTEAGRIFRQWFDAYNAADSAALVEYARQHEPETNIALNLVGRGQSGGVDVQSVERNEPRHIELVLKTRRTALVVYAVVDVDATPLAHASTALAIVGVAGDSFNREALRIGATERAAVIDSLAGKISRNYVFPELGKQIIDSLNVRRARGAYDQVDNQIAFAQRLTRELFEIAHDKHTKINYAAFVSSGPSPGLPAPSAAPRPSPGPPPSPNPGPAPGRTPPPCGFEGSVLDGNIGYVTFSNFRDPQECGESASRAMNAIAASRAVIIDLRQNAGGSPAMVAYLASYLFTRKTHLNDSWTRSTGATQEWWTSDDVPGSRFGDTKPVYILTSTLTISAAEEFAYDLQALKRATVVGETTAGAAHMTGSGPIGPHLMVVLPIARPINPITKGDWEGVGVVPDVRVPAGDALTAAARLIRGSRP